MTKENDGKSIARTILGGQPDSDRDQLTQALQADSAPKQQYASVDSKTVFGFMEPDDFEHMFRDADKDSSYTLSKEELEEFKRQAENEPNRNKYSPPLDKAAQLLIENYEEATDLAKGNYGIFDDRFSAKHYKSDPVAGMLSRQDFDMLKMFSGGPYVNDYSRDDYQSEMQRNSRACFLFAATAMSISNAILSRRIPLLSYISLGVGAVTAGLATNSLLNDHPTLREYKQRKNVIESWELQVPLK